MRYKYNNYNKYNMTENSVINNNPNIDESTDIQEYLEQLSENERKIIETAKEVLGSSFNINKSIGFEEWKKNSK